MPFVASCNNENYAGLLLHTRLQLPDRHLVALDRERIRFRVLARNKLVDICQKFRILHQDRACEVGTEKIIHSHALACAVAAVAQTELYGKHRLVDALDLAALVDKTNKRLAEKVSCEYRVGGVAGLVLLGYGKAENFQTVVNITVAVGYCLAEHLKGVAREKRCFAAVDIRLESVALGQEIRQNRLLAAFGTRTYIHKIVFVEIDVVAVALLHYLAGLAALDDHVANREDICVLAVEIHDVVVHM